jgi:transcriptional regulator with XRE-family HTH domain
LTLRQLTDMLQTMSKSLTDQIRDAVRESKLSRYRICQETGIDKASMSKFVNGERGLSLASLDKLAALLELRVISEREDG